MRDVDWGADLDIISVSGSVLATVIQCLLYLQRAVSSLQRLLDILL